MLSLLLMRHAKSSWDDPKQEDYERPLNKRGASDAPHIAAWIVKHGLKPDLVLCSGAIRTRGTLALMLPQFTPPPEVCYEEDLYLASAGTMLDRIRKVEGTPRRVMVVGHNPGTHALALELIGAGDRKQITQLAIQFPTAGLAVIDFAIDKWRDVRPASGGLSRFVSPRTLD